MFARLVSSIPGTWLCLIWNFICICGIVFATDVTITSGAAILLDAPVSFHRCSQNYLYCCFVNYSQTPRKSSGPPSTSCWVAWARGRCGIETCIMRFGTFSRILARNACFIMCCLNSLYLLFVHAIFSYSDDSSFQRVRHLFWFFGHFVFVTVMFVGIPKWASAYVFLSSIRLCCTSASNSFCAFLFLLISHLFPAALSTCPTCTRTAFRSWPPCFWFA